MTSTARINPAAWPENALEPASICPVCRDTRRNRLHAGLVDDTFFTAAGRWTLQKCQGCGSAYLDPRPLESSVGAAYANYYTHEDATPAAAPATGFKPAVKRLLGRISQAYVTTLANPDHGASRTDRLLAWLLRALPPFRQVVDARYRHLRRPAPTANRLLDIGCGSGAFLQRARSLGWDTEGVDFDPRAVAVAQTAGLNVHVGSIDAYEGVNEAFDVVTCNHVIEHVYDPAKLVAAMYRILKPGGQLWIETPNIDSAGHAAFGKAWRGLETPRHIVVFNEPSLADLLKRSGFVITHRTPWNLQHIRQVYAASEAILAGGNPNNTRTPALPNWRLAQGLLLEALFASRREFVCLRAIRPGTGSQRASH